MKQVKRDAFSRRRRIRWKFIIPLLVLVLLLVYIGVTLANPHKVVVVQPKYAICDYSLTKAQAEFKKMSFDDTVELKEHLYYGENLNLYNESFQLGKTDPFIGQTVSLVNLCNGSIKEYDLRNTIDKQISLDVLPVGFYEVYIKKIGSEPLRLVSESVVHDLFYTVRRTVEVEEETKIYGKKIELVADVDLIEPSTPGTTIFDKNYVFIRVIEEEVPNDIYDVVIDPSRNQNQYESLNPKNGVIIQDALVDSANLLKSKLEAYGLKVLVLRDKEVISRNGNEGRMAKLYVSKAKYYIALDINYSDNPTTKGAKIMYSHYSSNSFSKYIFERYLKAGTVTAYGGSTAGNNPGIFRGKATEYMSFLIDSYVDIRESGGKILGAGFYETDKSVLNKDFASQNLYGVQSILLDLLYITNLNDKAAYTTQHDALMESIALGFADFLKLEKTQ